MSTNDSARPEPMMAECAHCRTTFDSLRQGKTRRADTYCSIRCANIAHPDMAKPEDFITALVDRFLAWRLPEDFHPDCGISFDAEAARKLNPRNSRFEPVGTNLFTADQARKMFEHVLGGARCIPSTERASEQASYRIGYMDGATGQSPQVPLTEPEQAQLRMRSSIVRGGYDCPRKECFYPQTCRDAGHCVAAESAKATGDLDVLWQNAMKASTGYGGDFDSHTITKQAFKDAMAMAVMAHAGRRLVASATARGFPEAAGDDARGGWRVDPNYLQRLQEAMREEPASLEQIEAVLLAVDACSDSRGDRNG